MTSFMLGKSIRSFLSSVSCLPVCLSVRALSITLSLACMSPAVISFSLSLCINFYPSHYFSHPSCLFQFIQLHLLLSHFIISSLLILSGLFSLSPLCDHTFPMFPQDCVPPLHSRACLSDRRSLSILPWPLMTSSSLPSCSCCHCTWESEQDKWALRPFCAKVQEWRETLNITLQCSTVCSPISFTEFAYKSNEWINDGIVR